MCVGRFITTYGPEEHHISETGFLSAMPWSAAGSKLQEKARYGEQEKEELKQEDY